MLGKWIYLAQRNPRLSRDQFVQRWLNHRRIGVQPDMAAEFVGASYCSVRSDKAELDMLSEEYDGVGLFPLKGLYSIPTIAFHLQHDYIKADELRFFTMTSDRFSIFCAENVVASGPETKSVILQFLRRNSNVTPSEFNQQWQQHSDAFLNASRFGKGVSRYVQNTLVAPAPPGFRYDGVAELWFENDSQMVEAAPEINGILADSGFIDANNSFFLMTDIIMNRPRKV
jgi:EthD domain